MGMVSVVGPGMVGLASAAPAPATTPTAVPRVAANVGLMFQSQQAGEPNGFSGSVFVPLSQGKKGEVLYFDLAGNLNFGGPMVFQDTINLGASSRLGYRWLSSDRRWMYGVNAGIDARAVDAQTSFQAGVGLEALSRKLELRLNGYVPFSYSTSIVQSGWNNAYLLGNQLLLDGWNSYVVPLGGVNLELGIPVARWQNNSIWVYGSYYYLSGDYVNGSSGLRGRAEWRLGDRMALGATISYDNIFQTQASGYVRFGSRPLVRDANSAIDEAERDFLALRGQPMQRQADIRMVYAQQNLPLSTAVNPATGLPWVVRCTGATVSTSVVGCAYSSLDGLASAATPGDVLLVGGGATANFAGAPRDAQGRPTFYLPAGITLTTAAYAPTLGTQFGTANLASIFGTPIGANPSFNTGVLSIGSNTTISGFNFTNTSITNYSTSNVLIANNTFTGSYTDNPTSLADAQAYQAIQVSANALPAIQFNGVSNVTIANNSFIYPQVQAYLSQKGTVDGAGEDYVCNQNNYKANRSKGTQEKTGLGNASGLCLSGNAIRMNNFSNAVISGNSVTGALDEAFRINNPSGSLQITNNFITGMRMGPDSNIGSAIILGMNSGSATVAISGNTITDNSPGVYPIVKPLVDGKTTVDPVDTSIYEKNNRNVIDPIELGLCRGKTSFPRMSDLYASPDFSGDCSQPTRLTLNTTNNNISLPGINARPGDVGNNINQDGDGIDYNTGTNAILFSNMIGNRIFSLGQADTNDIGDNGLTFDTRGTAQVNLNIVNNLIRNSADGALGFGIQNTDVNGNPGSFRAVLSGNVFGDPNNPNDPYKPSPPVELEIRKRSGLPATTANFYGTGDNELLQSNIKLRDPQGPGSFPNVFVNNQLIAP